MLASFQLFGTVPSCNDLINISVSGFFISSRESGEDCLDPDFWMHSALLNTFQPIQW